MRKKVSVIIPVYNEEEFIVQSIESLLQTSYPIELLEFIIVDGNSSDATVEKLKAFARERNINIKILHNPQRLTPISLNMGIKASSGDIIIRADAHSIYPPKYIDHLLYWKDKLGADNVGGVFVDTPKENTKINHAIVSVLNSKFGVGNSLFRTQFSGEPIEVDTVPYGIFDKKLFEKIGMYNERLARNQDIELNKRIRRNGGKIYLIPHIHIKYFPRTNLKDFARYAFINSLWNIRTIFITKELNTLSLRHFVPLFFVLALLTSLILGIALPIFRLIFFIIFFVYLFTASFACMKMKNPNTSFFHKLLALFVLHFFYGLGEIWGIITTVFEKRRNTQT